MELRLLFTLVLLAAAMPPVFAGSPEYAGVTPAVGDVRIVDKANGAVDRDPLATIKTGPVALGGVQSRAELIFPNHTLTRLGAETVLRFKPGSRDLLLERGTLLLQVPKFHGGTRVRTGSLTATSGSATFLIEHLPTKSVKIVVLEGDLRLSVNGFLGDSIVLTPGKMLITNPDVRRLPDPVDVDLRTLARTSSLINPALFTSSPEALPSLPLIERKIAQQDRRIQGKTLFPTNLVILGSGTSIVIPAEPAAQPAGDPPADAAPAGDRNQNGVRNSADIAVHRKPAGLSEE